MPQPGRVREECHPHKLLYTRSALSATSGPPPHYWHQGVWAWRAGAEWGGKSGWELGENVGWETWQGKEE